MSEELKPCPFCGGEAIMGIACHVHEDYAFRVECRECKIVTPFYDTEAEAIEAWNRRMSGSAEEKLKAFWDGMSAEMREERTAKVDRYAIFPVKVCGICHSVVDYPDKYCSECGAKLDWSNDE